MFGYAVFIYLSLLAQSAVPVNRRTNSMAKLTIFANNGGKKMGSGSNGSGEDGEESGKVGEEISGNVVVFFDSIQQCLNPYYMSCEEVSSSSQPYGPH